MKHLKNSRHGLPPGNRSRRWFGKIPEKEWLDKQDIMVMLNISERTLQRYRSSGKLPFSRIMGKIFYRREAVVALLEHNENIRV